MKKMFHVTPSVLVGLALAACASIAACESDTSPSGASFDAGADGTFTPTPTPTADAAADARAPEDGGAPDVVEAPVSADFATDFSNVANPSGAWTFGYTAGSPEGDGGALVAFTTPKESTGYHLWIDPTHVNLDAPSAFHNASNSTINGVAPGEAGLHPGSVAEYAVARWTAPRAGTYAVKVQFKEGDQGDTNGLLLHNGVVLVNEASTSTNAVHDLTVTLAAGDKLDVAVGNKGDFLYDSTPVIFSIRSSP